MAWIAMLVQTQAVQKINNDVDVSGDGDMFDKSSGVIFQGTGELIMSNSFVIIPINFTFHELIINLGRLRVNIGRSISNIRPYEEGDELLTDMIKDLEIMEAEVDAKVAFIYDFLYGLAPVNNNILHRTKRGAVNLVGNIANALFGVATEKQLDGLNKVLANISELSDENAKNLNIIDNVLTLTTDHLDKMRHSQEKIWDTVKRVVNQTMVLNKLQKKVEHRELLAHTFSKLSVNLVEFSETANQLIDGIRVMFGGKLDNRIIDNKYFSFLLDEIRRHEHKLLVNDKNKIISTYRALTTITAMYDTTFNSVHFFLALPVTDTVALPMLNLYQINAFPVPVRNTDVLLMYDALPKYIAANHEYYVEMDDLIHCTQVAQTHYCQLKSAIHTFGVSKSCASQLFKGNCTECLNKCKHRFLTEAFPMFLRIHNLVYYYTNTSTELEIICKDGRMNDHIILDKFGYFVLAPQCGGLGNGIRLPMSISFMSSFGKEIKLNTPSVFDVKLLNTSILPDINNETFYNITKEANGKYDLHDILIALKSEKFRKVQRYPVPLHHIHFIPSVILLMISLLAVVYVIHRLKKNEQLEGHTYETPNCEIRKTRHDNHNVVSYQSESHADSLRRPLGVEQLNISVEENQGLNNPMYEVPRRFRRDEEAYIKMINLGLRSVPEYEN